MAGQAIVKRQGEKMGRVEIEQRVYCPNPEFEGYQDLIDCKDCDYHEGIEDDTVNCSFNL